MEESREESAVILVVDDDESVLSTLAALVKSLGYTCLTAGNGKIAADILTTTRCDIVLADLIMPHMNGMDLLKHIIRYHFDTDVIIATGYTQQISYAEVIGAGAIDFIKKPIDQAELEAKLSRALRERRMIKELETLSMSDGLTTLLNRRAYDQHFPHEFERAYRQGYPLFLAIIDVDNFKIYNDSHGHDEGDKVLISLGETLNECTRNSVDLCFRLGGDEFAVLLPHSTEQQAKQIVERVLTKFVDCNFNGTTLSIGVVSCIREPEVRLAEDIRRMQKQADQAMYDAKNSGKNCVVCRI